MLLRAEGLELVSRTIDGRYPNVARYSENTSVHDAALHGLGGTVALNVGFLADGIAAITTPTIALYLNSAQEPVALKGVGDDSYTYVAMPMTVR